jgi:hypothetical protein
MDLRKIGWGGVWSGFTWLRIGTVGGLLWMRWWTFGFWRHGVSLVKMVCHLCWIKIKFKFWVTWRRCVIICTILPLDFFHGLNFKVMKLQRFECWILLSSPRQGSEKAESLSAGPLVNLDQVCG